MDLSQYTVILSAGNTVIVGGQAPAGTQTETSQDASAQDASLATGLSRNQWLIVYVLVIVVAYLISNWLQRKKENKTKEIQETIKAGDSVVTSNGFHGKVADVAEGVYILEFGINKGVRIPVNKSNVYPANEPEIASAKNE